MVRRLQSLPPSSSLTSEVVIDQFVADAVVDMAPDAERCIPHMRCDSLPPPDPLARVHVCSSPDQEGCMHNSISARLGVPLGGRGRGLPFHRTDTARETGPRRARRGTIVATLLL